MPLESEKEVEEDAKGKKKPAKDNKPEGGFEDPFPYTQSSFVMGIDLSLRNIVYSCLSSFSCF